MGASHRIKTAWEVIWVNRIVFSTEIAGKLYFADGCVTFYTEKSQMSNPKQIKNVSKFVEFEHMEYD